MSDLDYAQALAEGRDPLQEKVFERTLIGEGIDPDEAQQVSQLLTKTELSLQEQTIITSVWRKWCLLQGYDEALVNEVIGSVGGNLGIPSTD